MHRRWRRAVDIEDDLVFGRCVQHRRQRVGWDRRPLVHPSRRLQPPPRLNRHPLPLGDDAGETAVAHDPGAGKIRNHALIDALEHRRFAGSPEDARVQHAG